MKVLQWRKSRGFTLIELLLVVGTMLSTAAYTAYQNWTLGNKINLVSKSLVEMSELTQKIYIYFVKLKNNHGGYNPGY